MRMQLDDACESAWRTAESQKCYFWMCPKQMCYKVAGRCESLIENRPCSLDTMEHYIVCMFPSDIPTAFV